MQYSQYGQPIFEQREPGRRVNFGWISESFDLFKQQPGIWIMASVVLGVSYAVLSMMTSYAMENITPKQNITAPTMAQFMSVMLGQMPLSMVCTLPMVFILTYLMSGIMRMAIRQVKGEYVKPGDIFSGWPVTLRVFGVNFLITAVSMAVLSPIYFLFFDKYHANPPMTGWAVLGSVYIVSLLGAVVISSLFMPAYILAADGEHVFKAIARSFNAMKNDWLRAICLYFVYGIITFVSSLPCFIGLIVTVPMGILTLALVYRDMMGLPAPIPQEYKYAPQVEGSWPPPPTL